MPRFNPNSTRQARAVQVWQILVGAAMSRQTLTYLRLSQMMFGHDAAGVLAQILGHVAYYCSENDLPALTVIVVNNETGEPGADIPLNAENYDSEREAVYRFDWYDVYPPSEDELEAAFVRAVRD